MTRVRTFVVSICFPCAVALSQSAQPPIGTAAFCAALVVSADEHTGTSAGGSLEVDFFLSRSLSAGVAIGHWSGGSDFARNSTETYVDAVLTRGWATGRWRPFLQVGGGLYFAKFQFQSRNRFAPEEKETVGGGFAGAGVDYRLSDNAALEGRSRYHLVSDVSGVHTDFLETQLGVRVFF